MADGGVTVCAAGLKGAVFLEGLVVGGVRPSRIAAYLQPDDASGAYSKIKATAEAIGAEFIDTRRPKLARDALTFVVGWQYLFAETTGYTVVFHDSLLPKYRGFAPTVSALLNGDRQIGVTALLPTPGVDEGPIVGQLAAPVDYPMTIARALELQAGLMVDLALSLHAQWRQGTLEPREQDHGRATYSIWRDDDDYLIDWSRPAQEIARHVDAVGYPYGGARTFLDGRPLVVIQAIAAPDLAFVERHPGKIWKIEDGAPLVVCGRGLLRLTRCVTPEGAPVAFKKLRARLGSRALR